MSENVEQNAPLRITISEVKSLLDQGKSRKEIAEHYGKTQAEMSRMVWSHPKLKNLKAKKQYVGIELEDDEDAPVAEVAEVVTQVEEKVEEVAPEAVQAFGNQEATEEDPAVQDWN